MELCRLQPAFVRSVSGSGPGEARLSGIPLTPPTKDKVDKNNSGSKGSQPSVLARIRHIAGIDRAVAFTVMARGWSTIGGVLTVVLIARFLSSAEQGYYYTFASLIALQIVFELGFSFVILQLAAHEFVRVSVAPNGQISGDPVAHSRLASVLQKSVKWYSIAAILMAATLLPAGSYFFSVHRQISQPVHWGGPWACVVIAAIFTFQIDPVCSFMEGCGLVPQVARMRFTQAITGSLLAWTALILHHGLYAPAMMLTGQAIAGMTFLYSRKGLLLPLLRHRVGKFAIDWRTEILPFQWRIAISWLCGYFIFQIFNPVLFAYRGAAAAGQMGMSLSIASALSGIAVSWMSTKASPFGGMIAHADYANLDRLFRRTLIQSTVLLACGACVVLIGLAIARETLPRFAMRVLPEPVFAVLLATTLLNHIVFSEAIYLRAHKKEPFLILSVVVGILTASSTLITARPWGATGVTVGYFFTSGVVGLSFGSFIFLKKRREWHSQDMTDLAGEVTHS
jgi:hypothetical protein